jgi:hypothetical protein
MLLTNCFQAKHSFQRAAKSDQGNPEMSLADGSSKKPVRGKQTTRTPANRVKVGDVNSGHATQSVSDRECAYDMQRNYQDRLCKPYESSYSPISFKGNLNIAQMIYAYIGIFYRFFGERWMDKVHFSCIGVNGPIADISLISMLDKPIFHIAILYSNDHFMLLIERGGHAFGRDGLGKEDLLRNMAKQALSLFDLGQIPLRLMARAWVQSDSYSCGRLVLKAIAAMLSDPYSFDCKEPLDVESQDEAIILKDACEFAHRIGVHGTTAHAIISDLGEGSDIE